MATRTGPGPWLPATLILIGLLAIDVAASPSVDGAAPRPDIVVIYMDDFSPRVAELWSQPSRTPALARFVEEGVRLNASGSTPLCCPARANLLTGRYGHRTGVTRNRIEPFDPRRTVAVKLRKAGYHTAYLGKFLNGLRSEAPTSRRVRAYARGWSDFDVLWEQQGRYYDYRLWSRDGARRFGHGADDHSSRVIGLRAARRIDEAPRRKPLFMVVSLFDGHPPIRPMRRFSGHPACRRIDPFRTPSFNEADVSDKPAYVRRARRMRRSSFALRSRCEAIMTVDWVTQRVRAALARRGRLNDSLLVFTADNGTLMGDHRLMHKAYPYATPVPMYMSWPERWGRQARSIADPVSNLDLAPTFCRLAGCRLGGVDGRDITPLLDGRVDRLERRFVYEEMLHPSSGTVRRPAWYGIRTTLGYSERLWVYTEYASRERELYDLTDDPHQLENLAGRRRYADVQAELRSLLHDRVVRPDRVRFSRIRT
jgi:arylsulfatase A-like enzyme